MGIVKGAKAYLLHKNESAEFSSDDEHSGKDAAAAETEDTAAAVATEGAANAADEDDSGEDCDDKEADERRTAGENSIEGQAQGVSLRHFFAGGLIGDSGTFRSDIGGSDTCSSDTFFRSDTGGSEQTFSEKGVSHDSEAGEDGEVEELAL